MGLIQEGDFILSWNKWGDAVVEHIPSKATYVGCGGTKESNLKIALEVMEKVVNYENSIR